MGCFESCFKNSFPEDFEQREVQTRNQNKFGKRGPPWKSSKPITRKQLEKLRDDFWFSTKGTEGKEVIWETLKAATEAEDDSLMEAILEASGIILENGCLSVSYDLTGQKYELPNYVLRPPENLVNIVELEDQT